jgi:acyl-CoA reductase-like NAD-dependent aldehyde dehydrogenase
MGVTQGERTAPRMLEAVNPATGEGLGQVEATPPWELPDRVARAREAARTWGALPFARRVPALARLRDLVVARAMEVAGTVSAGMGKPLVESLSFDVAMVVDDLEDYIRNGAGYLADEPVALPPGFGPDKRALVRHAPRGVVAVIAPWNFPFELAMTPVLTALAAGNAVLVKPTSTVPLLGVLMERLLLEAFRDFPGLVQVLHGPGELGTALATAEGIDFVVFTGSTAVGRRLQAALAPLLRPALLELGGSDPMIVCEDANLERAANAAVFGRFCNAGQVCAAVKRVYVHRAVAAPFMARLLAKVRALTLGDPARPGTDVGPLANGRSLPLLRELLQDALDRGARLEAGGAPLPATGPAGPLFWPPTVLSGVDGTMRIMREESFGPILPVQVVEDDDEAVALANDTEYGLDAYVFSRDLDRAHALADRLKAGSVDINEVVLNYAIPSLPFGGIKASGQNRYHGATGLRLFCDAKAMLVDEGRNDTEPYWFPYTEAKLEAARERLG